MSTPRNSLQRPHKLFWSASNSESIEACPSGRLPVVFNIALVAKIKLSILNSTQILDVGCGWKWFKSAERHAYSDLGKPLFFFSFLLIIHKLQQINIQKLERILYGRYHRTYIKIGKLDHGCPISKILVLKFNFFLISFLRVEESIRNSVKYIYSWSVCPSLPSVRLPNSVVPVWNLPPFLKIKTSPTSLRKKMKMA